MRTSQTLFKIIIALLVATIVFLILTQPCFALGGRDISNMFANTKDEGNATNTVAGFMSKVINFAQVLGMGIAIIMLIVLAIRWIGSAPSGKAQIAKSSRYYIAGAIFIFAAVAILQIIKSFATKSI